MSILYTNYHCHFSPIFSRNSTGHHSNHIRPSSAGGTDSGSSSRKFSRPPGDEVYVRNYRLLKTIGKGNFAKVKLARHMPTGVEVCYVLYSDCMTTPIVSQLNYKEVSFKYAYWTL